MTLTSKMTTLLKNEIIGLMNGGSLVYDATGNLLVLTTDAPSDATYTPVVGFDYADVPVNLGDWSPPTSRIGKNAVELTFPAVSNAANIDAIAYTANGVVIERSSTGSALYSTSLQVGKAYQHLDEATFVAESITLDFNNHPLILGTDLAQAIYNATLRGETINPVSTFSLELTQNAPSSGADTVLDIPAIEIPGSGSFTTPGVASSFLTAGELSKYKIDANARACANTAELRTETLTKDYPEIGGWRLITDSGDIWWRGALSPSKYVYKDSQLKILPGAIVVAI